MNIPLAVFLLDEERRNEILSTNIRRRNLRDGSNPFDVSEVRFRSLYRLSRELAIEILGRLNLNIERRHGVPPHIQLLIVLRFFAQGTYQLGVGQDFHLAVGQTTVSKYIRKVTIAIIDHYRDTIKFPQNLEERRRISDRFQEKVGVQGIIGCIDCTHIKINRPREREEVFVDHYGTHSINVQMVCTEELKIINCLANYPGSVHDQFIFNNSTVKAELERLRDNRIGSYFLLGDSGYRGEEFLITPIRGAPEDTPEGRFTNWHCQVRNRIERAYGVIKARFRCVRKDRVLNYKPQMAAQIILCCTILHNLMLERRLPLPTEEEILGAHEIEVNEAIENQPRLNAARQFRQNIVNRYFT